MLGAAEIRELAERLEIRPTKKLGQNFVIDPNTIDRIVSAAHLVPGETVVEIGPGLGSLTLGILAQGHPLVAVEVDPKLAAELPTTIGRHEPGANFQLVLADAMQVTDLPVSPSALVANLPYNISVPVLLNFLERFPSIRHGLVMVQAEVAHRLAAQPNSKEYGAPSVKMAWYGPARLAGNIGRSVFWPVPGVDSALVYFERHRDGADDLRQAVFAVVDAGFGQRRKTLRQSLAEWAGSAAQAEQLLVAAGVSPQARAENLVVDDFVRIAEASR